MKILLLGSGGREHALALSMSQNKNVEIFANPGNPGIFEVSEFADIEIKNHENVLEYCETNNIDLVVIGPEQPLAEGLSDTLRNGNINVFGPISAAAKLESSKSFAKEFMKKMNIPTSAYATFTKAEESKAHDYINNNKLPLVLKADGLAAGKGVIIAETYIDAHTALEEMFKGLFNDAGNTVVIEEFMYGEEASVFAICDGKDFVTLAPSQDHKRVADGDKGKNTGGMGAYAPAKIVTTDILEKVNELIIKPVLKGMADNGTPFIGCLYCGLMISENDVKVVEFNVRFGDPETQSVLSIFEGDLASLFLSAAEGKIDKSFVSSIAKGTACNVVLASDGYPDSYKKGFEISGIKEAENLGVKVYHAGTKLEKSKLITSGGRVLAVNGTGETLEEAIENAYKGVDLIKFENKYFRTDIGKKA